jgi:hypothetical protein
MSAADPPHPREYRAFGARVVSIPLPYGIGDIVGPAALAWIDRPRSTAKLAAGTAVGPDGVWQLAVSRSVLVYWQRITRRLAAGDQLRGDDGSGRRVDYDLVTPFRALPARNNPEGVPYRGGADLARAYNCSAMHIGLHAVRSAEGRPQRAGLATRGIK